MKPAFTLSLRWHLIPLLLAAFAALTSLILWRNVPKKTVGILVQRELLGDLFIALVVLIATLGLAIRGADRLVGQTLLASSNVTARLWARDALHRAVCKRRGARLLPIERKSVEPLPGQGNLTTTLIPAVATAIGVTPATDRATS